MLDVSAKDWILLKNGATIILGTSNATPVAQVLLNRDITLFKGGSIGTFSELNTKPFTKMVEAGTLYVGQLNPTQQYFGDQ